MKSNATQKVIEGDGERTGSSLCNACGLCCQGVIFEYLYVHPDDEVVPQLELPVLTNDAGYNVYYQPCPHHVQDRCSIYEHRFRSCRTYACHLLRRLESREVALDEALAIVKHAKELVANIYSRLAEPGPRKPLWKVVREHTDDLRSMGASKAKQDGELLLWIRMLSLVLHRYFEPKLHQGWNENDKPLRAGGMKGVEKEAKGYVQPAGTAPAPSAVFP